MPDREKVMRGLEAHSRPTCETCDGQECPYYRINDEHNNVFSCSVYLVSDALALLKEQEARVMKPEEIPDYDGAIYLEDFGEPEIVIAVYDRGVAGRVKFAIRGTRSTIAGYDDYNKRWRAWTSRPTEEQRKAVKWDA